VWKVLTCLAVEHDYRLVGLALAVCVTACLLAFRLFAQAQRESRFFRNLWLAATGVCAGSGVWATHFIAMLAYKPGLPVGFEPIGTTLSWLIAVGGMGLAFSWANGHRRRRDRLFAGAGLGLAVCAMHFIGMSALRTQGVLHWDWTYVAASVAAGVLLAAVSMQLAGDADRWSRRILAGVVLALAVASLHFTGMSAVSLQFDPTVSLPQLTVPAAVLATTIAFLMVVVILSALGAMFIAGRSQVQALGDLREAIEAMPAGLAFYDRDDRCIVFNQTYAEHGGKSGFLLRPGVHFRELIEAQLSMGDMPDAVGREQDWLDERLAARRAGKGPVEQQNGDRWLRVEDRKTASGGTISIIHDITDLKRNAEVLQAARDQAEAANRAKSEFLANMSHELRTPLNGVIGVAEVLAQTRMTARQREMLDTVRSSALTLQGVLADLLDLARIESGRLDIASERMAVGEVVRDAASLWRLEAAKKGLNLAVEVAPEAEADIEGDQVRLRQIVVNLLSNAVKFTDRGEVVLTLGRSRQSPDTLVLEVRDTGIGFSPEIAERLFARFEQADGSVTRRFGGTGLGLAISRDLVERMGGRIWATGRPGDGASFHVELPAPPLAPLADQPLTAAEPEAVARARLRVLYAEDHPVNRKVVEFILGAAGVDLVCAVNGADALDLFRTSAFDAVLMDMQMPVMDGLSATRCIRQLEAESARTRTPVIMVTANAMPEHVQSSMAAGADRHLTKPISADRLLALLDEVTSSDFLEADEVVEAA
jgi:signal transduction histidine kinase/AmiR/NasT family two-component response regulator